MGKYTEDRATHYHNEGQKDAAKGPGPGNYKPPKSLFHSIVDSQADKDNKDYRDGHRHGRRQHPK